MVSLRMLRALWISAGWMAAGALSLPAAESNQAAAVTQPAERPTLSAAQSDQLAALAAEELSRPAPKPRPRLKEGDVLSEEGRGRVHGGMSFTVGGGSGGSFYGTSAWATYYDPALGLAISVAFSHFNGPGYYSYGYPYLYPGMWNGYSPALETSPLASPLLPPSVTGRR